MSCRSLSSSFVSWPNACDTSYDAKSTDVGQDAWERRVGGFEVCGFASGAIEIRWIWSVVGRGPDLRIVPPSSALMKVLLPALNSPATTAEKVDDVITEGDEMERVDLSAVDNSSMA